jgi:CRP-like cAMP-binding protein
MRVATFGASGSVTLTTLLSERPRRRFETGSRLFHEGDAPVEAFFIDRGLVKLVKTAQDGTESLLEFRGTGTFVGERSVIDGLPRMTSGVAAIPTSAAPVPRDQLVACIRRDPDLALIMLTTFAGCVREAVGHLLDLRVGTATSLVATRLVQLARDPTFESIRVDRGATIEIEMPMTQQELASWAGVSHRSATSILQQLRVDGVISTSRHHLEVRDPMELAKRCIATTSP